MVGLVAGIAIGTDLGIPAMLSGEASLGLQGGLQVCGCARFCIDPAVVSRPFLTTAANVIGRVTSVLTKTVRPRETPGQIVANAQRSHAAAQERVGPTALDGQRRGQC